PAKGPDALGREYKNNLSPALSNMRKVPRHVLVPDGATFTTKDEDFLVSDNRDFHPTDVIEDADGSLLVIDTGGWYKLCCPTSQLHKPDVLGAIYRVRRQGAPRLNDPRGRQLAWSKMPATELARLLDDPRPAVRQRAVQVLADRDAAVDALRFLQSVPSSAEARRNVVWAVTRVEHETARAAARMMLNDEDETVRQAAIHAAGV